MKVYLVWENYYDYENNWKNLEGIFGTAEVASDECIRLTSLLPKGESNTEYY